MTHLPTNADFAQLAHGNFARLKNLIDELAHGKLDVQLFGDRFHEALVSGHRDAWHLGARLGGRSATDALHAEANLYGQEAADGESEWLDNFLSDIENGRYTDEEGNLKVSSIQSRSRLYSSKSRASANQGLLDAGAAHEEYEWRMTALEHCDDCPRMAALSPYRAHELFTTPGAGDTECISNCKCILIRLSDGVKGFSNPF